MQAAVAWKIRFISEPEPGMRVVRRFTAPVNAIAATATIKPTDIPVDPAWTEPADHLYVVHQTAPTAPGAAPGNWLAPPADSAATLPASISLDDLRIRWRPGRALIESKNPNIEHLLPALAEFAFHEGKLREMEADIAEIERSAPGDVPRCFVPDARDKSHWLRFARTMERLAALRLAAARLEPRLYLAARDLPMPARRILNRLRARADVESRLEALSDRVEACEDLYEGAIDRINDLRWYRRGMVVEIAIAILLFLEVLQLAASLWLHGHG